MNNKLRLRVILGVIFSLVFVFSIFSIFWGVGIVNSFKEIIIAINLGLLFVFCIVGILFAIYVPKRKNGK